MPSPRERLLDAAADVFYREGVATGIEAVCKAAGVSKRSMYQLFDSKDDLLAAALGRRGPMLSAQMAAPPGESGTSRDRVLSVFRQLEKSALSPNYHGCPYLSAQVELKNPRHIAGIVAARAKQKLTDFFRNEAALGGAADPWLLARQLMLVYDGGSARAGIRADNLEGLAVTTAAALLDAAGILD